MEKRNPRMINLVRVVNKRTVLNCGGGLGTYLELF